MVSVGFSAPPVVNWLAVGDEEVVDVVRLAIGVAHAVLRRGAHAAGAEVVGGSGRAGVRKVLMAPAAW